MSVINVIKRDGSKEVFDPEKINRVISWACEGFKDVNLSDIVINAKLNVYDGITTDAIHSVLVSSAINLFTEQSVDYQWVASRLLNYQLRKNVWGSSEPVKFLDLIKKNTENGVYDSQILERYSVEDIEELEAKISHERDFNFNYTGIKQLCDKYLLKHRKTSKIYETPQFMYMLIAMVSFINYPKSNRLSYVKKAYDKLSLQKVNLPTPQIAGIRTPTRQYSSCCLLEIEDSMDSLAANWSVVGKATAKRFGIGIGFSNIRAIGTEIRNGEVLHTGLIPFLKTYEAITKSCHQNGVRGGSATVFLNWWHYEILDIVSLKNNGGTDDNRVRKLDYSINFNKTFYTRFLKNEDITLFSPNEVPELTKAMALDTFEEVYLKCEKDPKIKYKKKISARKLFTEFIKERTETGRIYLMNSDLVNSQGVWIPKKAPVYQSNLCLSYENKLLTDQGYVPIGSLEGKTVNIWNGYQWSKVTVYKTGYNRELYEVKLSNFQSIFCTDNHTFHLHTDYDSSRKNKFKKVTTLDLKIDDKLCKSELNYICKDNLLELEDAYTNGIFTAEGFFFKNKSRIWLYGKKAELKPYIKYTSESKFNYNRIGLTLPDTLQKKFFVPFNYSLKSKLEWLAGFLDGDGCLLKNENSYSLQFSSVNETFVKDVYLFLNELGISSNISIASEEAFRPMPDGKNGKKDYLCKKAYRITISSYSTYKLIQLGLKTKRLNLELVTKIPNREANNYLKVIGIEKSSRVEDTYCLTEPYNNTMVVNGALVGNCMEIVQPTKPVNYLEDPDGEIGICVLSAINVLNIKDQKDMFETCDIIVRMLDELIDYQDYFLPAAENFIKNRRSLGIGITNLAAYLAKNGYLYTDEDAPNFVDELMESIQYNLLSVSCTLAEEKGACAKFSDTKYSLGIMPLDRYKKEVDAVVTRKPSKDWESLKQRILKFGLRHSTLTAQPPTESSSLVSSATNGIEPVRALLSYKGSKSSVIPILVPEHKKWKYTKAFEMKSNTGYLNIVAAIQKWMDMSVSTNTYYKYADYENGIIPDMVIIKDILYAYRMGIKTLYYSNTDDGAVLEKEDDGCSSGACSV